MIQNMSQYPLKQTNGKFEVIFCDLALLMMQFKVQYFIIFKGST